MLVLSPENLSVRFHGGTRIEEMSVVSPAVAVLPDDPDAAEADVVVGDRDELPGVAVDGLCTIFEPLAGAVRERAPFGLRGMWGTLADHLAEGALSWARDHGGDREAAWAEAEALIDGVAARQPLLRARPRPHRIGRELFADNGRAASSTRSTSRRASTRGRVLRVRCAERRTATRGSPATSPSHA